MTQLVPLKYKLVIFDSDGTLADTIPWMRSVFNELADEYGFKRVVDHEFEQHRDLHGSELLKALDLPLWKVPRVVGSMRSRMSKRIDQFTLFPGISNVLERLSDVGIQLAIVSSNSRPNVEQILGSRCAALISHYACGASMFGKAPHLRSVLRASKISPEHALYVGDEIRDAEAAQKAGIAFGAVAWGQQSEAALRTQNPAEFFTTPEQLGKLCVCKSTA